MVDMTVKIKELTLKNPVITASGTFGSGQEYQELMDLSNLGAIVTKAVSLNPIKGNHPPRIVETAAGMLNAIGMQNDGVDNFVDNILPTISEYKTNIIVNLGGHEIDDYVKCATILNQQPSIAALELNISCPNVKKGGLAFGTDPETVYQVVKSTREAVDKLLIVKLSPNVTSITRTAEAAIKAGADALSLINTLSGMAIDIGTRKPVLSNITGGLSGPAIKPVALKMVWEVRKAFAEIPIIGLGGITSWQDAIEFLIAGANAVQVGTANFLKPDISLDIIKGMENYLETAGLKLQDLSNH